MMRNDDDGSDEMMVVVEEEEMDEDDGNNVDAGMNCCCFENCSYSSTKMGLRYKVFLYRNSIRPLHQAFYLQIRG